MERAAGRKRGKTTRQAVALKKISENNEDNRSYKVSAEKIMQVGFTPSKTIEDAIKEIKDALTNKTIGNYKDIKYNNYKLLCSSKEMQNEVFIKGITGSLDVP